MTEPDKPGHPKKVSVVFMNKPNFNELGFKFMVLTLNKMQKYFEFEFPEIDDYPMEEKDYQNAQLALLDLEDIKQKMNLDGDYFIGIITGLLGANWFWGSATNFAVVTTKDWKKTFVPPSVLEYMIHCIVSVLIIMTDTTGSLHSHHPTRGCCLDYTYLKEEDRVDIALGYICSYCKSKIREALGEDYLECFESMNTIPDWLGEVDKVGTVAYKLNKYFKVDLRKDTGFHKTFWDKTKEHLAEIPKGIVIAACSAIISAIVTFVLVGS